MSQWSRYCALGLLVGALACGGRERVEGKASDVGPGASGGAPGKTGGASGATGGVRASTGGTQGTGGASTGGVSGVGGATTGAGGQANAAGGAPADCTPKLVGLVRDFNSSKSPVNPHPDFETFLGAGITAGLVMSTLGTNGAPAYADPQPAGEPQLTSKSNFDLWYSVRHPANAKIPLDLDAPPASANLTKTFDPLTGATTYESTKFFPIDGKGTQSEDLPYGEIKDENGNPTLPPFHNYHFTFELNTKFIYKPGQVFSFYGDDDLWVFIDKKLVVDVGGVHPQNLGQVALDTLGLTAGQEYDFSLFHANRHTTTSNFKITTNLTFSNCEVLLR